MKISMPAAVELLKHASSLISIAPPQFSAHLIYLFPFINPDIIISQAVLASLISALVSVVVFEWLYLARYSKLATTKILIYCVILSIVSYFLTYIAAYEVFDDFPIIQDMVVRIFYIAFFGALAAFVGGGWFASRYRRALNGK